MAWQLVRSLRTISAVAVQRRNEPCKTKDEDANKEEDERIDSMSYSLRRPPRGFPGRRSVIVPGAAPYWLLLVFDRGQRRIEVC